MTLPNLRGDALIESDYVGLAARYIDRGTANGGLLRRVSSLEGRELVGRSGKAGDFSGISIAYAWPGEGQVREYRIRRDHPDREAGAGGKTVEKRKYMGPPGRGNMLYLPPQTRAEWLADSRLPVVITEGEFKCLSLYRLSWHGLSESAECPAFLPIGLQGVWNWRGTIGKATDEDGARVDVKGAVPDFDRILWEGRRVVIVFDVNVASIMSIAEARRRLTELLYERLASEVAWFTWPADVKEGINGVDDLLAERGPDYVIRLLARAKPIRHKGASRATAADAVAPSWSADLLRTDRGPKPNLANALIALRKAPEWKDILAFDEFAVRTVAPQGTPWRAEPCEWGDTDDCLLAEWMQHQEIDVSPAIANQAAEVRARENGFHPVRDYLRRCEWDQVARLDTLLPRYFGALDTPYARAVGARWMISAVARVMQPGCQADHCLILQGVQGLMKSTALRTLAGDEWFNDDIEELGSKDSAMQIHGKWIIELGELDAIVSQRSEMSKVKAFITRRIDHFRPPYGRRTADYPRQCVFAGSINADTYLRDETGARRFWPVACTHVDLSALTAARDQLWAEARARHDAGAVWWLDVPELVTAAEEEQDLRYERDPWESLVWEYVEGARKAWLERGGPLEAFSIRSDEILQKAVRKESGTWNRTDQRRVGAILRVRGMEYVHLWIVDENDEAIKGPDGKRVREYRYRWPKT